MNEYFVYALVDPRDGSIFYIGKGKGDRPRQHLVESLRYKNDTKNAINPHKTRICKSHNIIINTLKLTAGNFDKFYGEDAVQHRYNKSVCHRGKLNGRYKDGKLCKTYNK